MSSPFGPGHIAGLIPPHVFTDGILVEPGLPCSFLVPIAFGKACKALLSLLAGTPDSLLPGGNNRLHTFLLVMRPAKTWPQVFYFASPNVTPERSNVME